MKGFDTSKKYEVLWKLINKGYIIPAWMPYPDSDIDDKLFDMVEIKINKYMNKYSIGYRGKEYEQSEQR